MLKVLMLGDSLIAGYDWQSRLPACKIDNRGVPGATSADLFNSLSTIKESTPTADVIVVMIGTNDILSGDDAFQSLLKKILIQLSHDYPASEILVTSLLPMQLPHLSPNTIESLNCHIEALTMQTGCCYLNVHKRFTGAGRNLFEDDGVHINPDGYAVWARALLEHIAFLIEPDDD
jgi:lysophospholipase L1-like esterase